MLWMVENTNAYVAERLEEGKRSKGRKREEVSTEELSLRLGIVMYMGVCSAPAVKRLLES